MKSSKPKKKTLSNRHQEESLTETQSQTDIYSRVTNKIVADLEKGNLTWRKPWSSDHLASRVTRPLRWNDIPYTGINTILLWATAAERDYTLSHWMTFKQAIELKGNVRKGEKGTQIVYADNLVKKQEDENGEELLQKIPYLKAYTVFNVNQIDGLPDRFYQQAEKPKTESKERSAELDLFFAQTKADIYTGTQACYVQNADRIQMPPFESFHTPNDFYATLAHEICHWTKHPSRLDRDFGRKKYGDEGYAKEELVAEIGACFLAAELGFEPKSLEQSAAYMQYWLKVLGDDKRFIFSAASHAQKAFEYIRSIQPS